MKSCMPGRSDGKRWEAFVDTAPEMLEFLESHTPLEFDTVDFPDSYAEKPGGSSIRHVEPQAFKMSHIGGWEKSLIDQKGINDSAPFPLTYSEITAMLKKGWRTVFQKSLVIPYRMFTGRKTQQKALLAGLLKGCLDLGVKLALDSRVTELVTKDGAVTGVKVARGGESLEIEAPQGSDHGHRGLFLARGI